MSGLYINRRLKIDEEYFSELEVSERGAVLVVLAEPGAGKSDLLDEFGRIWAVKRMKASQFRHRKTLPGESPLIIDALDEVAKIDHSAVDEIIVKAQEKSNGRVIFASRSYEWADARTRYVRECFNVDPIIVRIEPFTPAEQRRLFEAHYPAEDFAHFAGEVARFELSPLLGNPQFLLLFAAAYIQSNRQFTTKARIFRDAVARLAVEANISNDSKRRPAISEITAAASEVMAKVLLSGASGVSTKETLANVDYPYLPALASSRFEGAVAALDTRLFKPTVVSDCHEPVHRIVSEYCAALDLVRRIEEGRKPLSLKRVLAVVAPNGAVRDELRGLLGWMASLGPERVQRCAIALDPYAVLANGDPSQLAANSKRLLLDRLILLSESNPGFRRSDHWRSFSVGGFFSDELAGDLGNLLRSTPVNSPLIDLLLELLVNSGGPSVLAGDIRAILLNGSADRHTRMWASRAIIRLTGATSLGDLGALVNEATAEAWTVAADIVATRGADAFTDENIEMLLRGFAAVCVSSPNVDGASHMASFYLGKVVEQFPPARLARHLDVLTSGLACTCQRPKHDCRCRLGVSKIAGQLLDRYFAEFYGPIHPDRIWAWLKALWFHRQARSKESAAVRYLADEQQLRRQLHLRAFAGVRDYKGAHAIRWHLSDGHAHTGLSFQEGDERHMADFAFSSDNPNLWSAFWSAPQLGAERRGPDHYRRRLREQAVAKPLFSAEWTKLEREHRAARSRRWEKWGRRQRRWQRRDQKHVEATRADLIANLDAIEKGQNWFWVRLFAEAYLFDRTRLAQLTDHISIAENALRNCLPLLADRIPSVGELALGKGSGIAQVLFASCWLQYRDRGSLTHVDRPILVAARTQTAKYVWMTDEEHLLFERELDSELFRAPQDAEAFARGYIEPGLATARDSHTHVWWLTQKEALAHLRAGLSIEWLRNFPAMPVSARRELFDLAARTGDRRELLDIIRQRISEAAAVPTDESKEAEKHRLEDLRFWQVCRFFFESSDKDGWDELCADPGIVFILDTKAGRFGDGGAGWPTLTAEKIYKILNAFVEVWRPVPLPSSYGTDDPPEERAYRFLTEIVWRIGLDSPEQGLPIIDKLIADTRFDNWKPTLRTLRAECARKLALVSFRAPSPEQIVAMLDASGIASVEDLRAFAVEELEELQAWLKTAETNPRVTYYNQNGTHVDENTARNRVVDRLSLRMATSNMPIEIERHMAGGNRCDLTVTAMIEGRRRLLVVEAKGQWHPEIFTAASTQLSERYASHHDAEMQGIYLVFWFGSGVVVGGRKEHGFSTATELHQHIVDAMPSDLRGLIDVFVLDLS